MDNDSKRPEDDPRIIKAQSQIAYIVRHGCNPVVDASLKMIAATYRIVRNKRPARKRKS